MLFDRTMRDFFSFKFWPFSRKNQEENISVVVLAPKENPDPSLAGAI